MNPKQLQQSPPYIHLQVDLKKCRTILLRLLTPVLSKWSRCERSKQEKGQLLGQYSSRRFLWFLRCHQICKQTQWKRPAIQMNVPKNLTRPGQSFSTEQSCLLPFSSCLRFPRQGLTGEPHKESSATKILRQTYQPMRWEPLIMSLYFISVIIYISLTFLPLIPQQNLGVPCFHFHPRLGQQHTPMPSTCLEGSHMS